MQYRVLGIGYLQQEHDVKYNAWLAHGVTFDLAGSIYRRLRSCASGNISASSSVQNIALLQRVRGLPIILCCRRPTQLRSVMSAGMVRGAIWRFPPRSASL